MTEVFRPARSAGQDFGTLIHAWLARVTWLEDGLPALDLLRRVAVEEVGWQRDVEEQIQQLQTWLKQPALRNVLSYKHLLAEPLCAADKHVVENERRFALRHDGKLMTGSIDRLVLYERAGQVVGADLLDYKTDGLPAGDAAALAEKVEFYRPQLAAYAQAVQRMYDLEAAQCRSRLVFLSTDDVITLEGSPPHEVSSRRGPAHRQPVQRPLFG